MGGKNLVLSAEEFDRQHQSHSNSSRKRVGPIGKNNIFGLQKRLINDVAFKVVGHQIHGF